MACLAFTKSGSHFYSGGHERVLVKWTVDNPNHRSTLPRLPGGVCHIAVGPENHRVAICTQDNGKCYLLFFFTLLIFYIVNNSL